MNQTIFADTPVSRCAYYRHTCGLPAALVPERSRIVVRAGIVGAIAMPGGLGLRVRDDMVHRRVRLGPIISHVGSKRWTYLCRPDIPDDMRLFAELFALNVTIVPMGGEIALPSPADSRSGYRCWIVPPRETSRPSGLAIVDEVRACAARGPAC